VFTAGGGYFCGKSDSEWRFREDRSQVFLPMSKELSLRHPAIFHVAGSVYGFMAAFVILFSAYQGWDGRRLRCLSAC
jgi:hypothetical protein